MKNRTKILLLALCAVLLVATSIFGTLAYLTSEDKVTNTFTVGKVHLKLDEADVDPYTGETDSGNRVKQNEYHLLPGHEYIKDPTVTVLADSEDCYVRMLVTVTFKQDIRNDPLFNTDISSIFTGFNTEKWNRTDYTVAADGKSIVYEYRYFDTVGKNTSADTELEPLFKTIVVPGTLTNDTIKVFSEMEINVVAHAIQADGFDTAEAAWNAFKTQNPNL